MHIHLDTSKEILDSSFYVVNGDFDRFSKKWFEMEITFPMSGVSSDGSRSPSPAHSLASSFKAGQSYYMGFEHTEETYSKEGGGEGGEGGEGGR